jgi:hypothetical protein
MIDEGRYDLSFGKGGERVIEQAGESAWAT